MKNLIFTLAFSILTASLFAQTSTLKGKNGQSILPETGDIGVGFNAVPVLHWFGNTFNNNSNNMYAGNNRFLNMFGNSVIMGRYMLADKTALRLHFGLNYINVSESRYVTSDASNNPEDQVLDTRSRGNGNFNLGLGYEMRRGKGRIQGYYGADLVLGLGIANGSTYTYGNGYSSTNTIPTSTNWGSNLNGNGRVLSTGNRTTLSAMVRPFIGVEYFVAPKLSIGGEFGWGISYAGSFQSSETVESYESSSNTVLVDVNKLPASGVFSFGTDNFNGAIFMFFYF